MPCVSNTNLSYVEKSSLYMIYLQDLESASILNLMPMQLGCTQGPCQYLRFTLSLCPATIWPISVSLYRNTNSLKILLSLIHQAYGDSSFLDCKRASEEAIHVIIKNLQVWSFLPQLYSVQIVTIFLLSVTLLVAYIKPLSNAVCYQKVYKGYEVRK